MADVFISHIHEQALIATAVQRYLQDTLTGKVVIPTCFGDQNKDQLPGPYGDLQGVYLPDDAEYFVRSVARHLGAPTIASEILSVVPDQEVLRLHRAFEQFNARRAQ
jgi:hypothetical protein